MTSERDTVSRLPREPDYWEGLSRRAIDAALGQSEAQLDPWWSVLSDRAYALAAAAAFALLGGSLLLGVRQTGESAVRPGPIAEAVAPDQPLLAAMLGAGSGPPAADLIFNLLVLREDEDR